MRGISKVFSGLGTQNVVTIFNPQLKVLLDNAAQIVMEYERLLTINSTESEIMEINRAAGSHPVHVSNISYQLIKRSVEVSNHNLGFNVAIGPLVQEWRIGFKDAHIPSQKRINEILQIIDPHKIHLEDREQTVFLELPGMKLDLGGIGKGYVADAIKTQWLQSEVEQGIINLGGNVLLVGKGPHLNNQWQVGVQSPSGKRNEALGVVTTNGGSIVTSGIYERFLYKNGKTYHHIFDSSTGYPLETDLKSVTVFTNTSLKGEIWSSLAFFNGPKKTEKLIGYDNSIGYVFVNWNNEVTISNNLKGRFKLKDNNYLLIDN